MANAQAKLQLGIVGGGAATEAFYVPALAHSKRWALGAMFETHFERRARWRCVLPDVSVHATLDERDVPLDAVVIATPPTDHREVAVRALRDGLHVLVEKPMGLSVRDVEAMRAAACQTERCLWAGYNRRFWSSYQALRDLVAGEALRRLEMALHTNPDAWNAVSGYLEDAAQGGGILYDLVAHQADLLCWLTGTEPDELKASWITRQRNRQTVQVEVRLPHEVTAHFEAGHGVSSRESLYVQGADGRNTLATPQDILDSRWIPRAGLAIMGYARHRTKSIWRKMSREKPQPFASHLSQLEAFGHAVQGKIEASSGAQAEDGLRVHRVLQACRESLAPGNSWVALERSSEEGLS